jgi:flagellin-specific chaperone FliS
MIALFQCDNALPSLKLVEVPILVLSRPHIYTTMISSQASNDHKRKPTEVAEAVVSSCSDDQSPKESKARRVSTDAATHTLVASSETEDVPVSVTTETTSTANRASGAKEDEATSKAEREKSLEIIGELVQNLSHSDSGIVRDSLKTLYNSFLDLDLDKEKCNDMLTVGGGHSLVLLVKKFLKQAATKFAGRDQLTMVRGCGFELRILQKSIILIAKLTYHNGAMRAGISAIGGVEAILEVMKTFPKCKALQKSACYVLANLTECKIGKKKAVESGGFEILLAAVNNHMISLNICEAALLALEHIIEGSKENTKLFMHFGGVAALTRVREECPDNERVQAGVRTLAKLIVEEMKTWIPE